MRMDRSDENFVRKKNTKYSIPIQKIEHIALSMSSVWQHETNVFSKRRCVTNVFEHIVESDTIHELLQESEGKENERKNN